MADLNMILGFSGTGKSTSIRTLDPKETFIIQVLNKRLPFRGSKKMYIPCTKENPDGNLVFADKFHQIIKTLDVIESRKEIKNIILDDIQYVILEEFLSKADLKFVRDESYHRYNELANHFWRIIEKCKSMREDLNIFFLSHSEIDDTGHIQVKTVGKLVSGTIYPPAYFTCVFMTRLENDQYFFQTQSTGFDPCKSPMGMFEDILIPNDLQYVIEKIQKYYNGDDDEIPSLCGKVHELIVEEVAGK